MTKRITARLAMLLLRLAEPNFYLLDEPTNHLDIEGQDMLERELVAHGAACLLVSHDRAFVRAVATRVWVIEGRRKRREIWWTVALSSVKTIVRSCLWVWSKRARTLILPGAARARARCLR